MQNGMEVGIFTFWTSKDNYGQTLQSFALQYFLNHQSGMNAEVIRYYATKLPLIVRIKNTVKRILLYICPSINRSQYENIKSLEERNFAKFKKYHIKYSSSISYGKIELNQVSGKYDALITGSDQVWSMLLDNPDNSVYYLDFGNKKQKRISYAASFGLQVYPSNIIGELHNQLSRLDYISVREEDGVDICNKAGVNSVHVLDPTFLLDKKVYEKLLKSPPTISYTFMYVLNIKDGDDIDWNNLRKEIATSLIIGTNGSGYTSSQVILDGIVYENSTIEKWLTNIAYADMIVTTSFHGVVFSIIFEKEFVFIPLKGKHAQSNNRVLSLLNKLDLTDRVLFEGRTFKQIEKNKIDYKKVNQKLDRFRNESIRFLMDSLNAK